MSGGEPSSIKRRFLCAAVFPVYPYVSPDGSGFSENRSALPFLVDFRREDADLYLALYRKYRPKTFADVLSQPHITTTLKNEIVNEKTAHAYLFTGSRGTGKTTCARILAMAVNCEHPVNGDPCMECETCRSIDQGATLDVVEIDAASNNGVDDVRQLREEAVYSPSQCRYRVYIIDEAHMLSAGAFNALLKIMEEPPEHVKFILATTEVHKVPVTILSRCQRFDFRRIRTEDIESRLLSISDEEPFTLTPDAASVIARLSDGGMRDALALLDQCASFANYIDENTVVQAAGIAGNDDLLALTDYIIEENAASALETIDKLYRAAKDLQVLLNELCSHFRDMMLIRTMRDPSDLITLMPEEELRTREQAQKLPLSSILSALSEMRDTLDKMGRSTDKRLLLELCMIRLCTPSLKTEQADLIARIEKLENRIRNGIPMVSAPVEMPASVETPRAVTPLGEQPKPEAVQAPEEAKPAPRPEIIPEQPPAPANAPQENTVQVAPLASWLDVLDELSRTNAPLFGMLQGARAFVKGDLLFIDGGSPLLVQMLKQEGNAIKLLDAVEVKTGIRYQLRVKRAKAAQQQQVDPLSALLQKAKESGVNVRED